MATLNYSQPLLNENSPKKTTKIILFFLSIVGCLSLIACIGKLVIQPNAINHLSLCDKSPDRGNCLPLLSHASSSLSSSRFSEQDLLAKIIENHAKDVRKVMNDIHKEKTLLNGVNNHEESGALGDCMYLMSMSRDRLSQVMKTLVNKYESNNHNDLNAWLSGILSNHFTCLNQLQQHGGGLSESLKTALDGLISRARVILSIEVKQSQSSNGFQKVLERIGIMSSSSSSSSYPSWMSRADRKLLEAPGSSIEADVVVAKDGSGDFTTVSEAIKAAPNKAGSKHVIRVKGGVYEEHVLVPSSKKNLVIVGDGMDSTIFTGDRYTNLLINITTFNSYTLAISADGVTLLDVGIKNTAGPEHYQAVALRINADKVAVSRCKIDGYQNSLYTHTYRQFYKDSTITGTIDIIFGYASAVFQGCKIIPRKPLFGQSNYIITAGRVDRNQFTAVSLQRCTIMASKDLAPVQGEYPSFLGRPWTDYSTAMVMQSYIGSVIDPKGWGKWSNDDYLDTLYFAEYDNYGPGSDTTARVDWPNYHVVTDPKEAMPFTVNELIQGQDWIDSSLVSFTEGL